MTILINKFFIRNCWFMWKFVKHVRNLFSTLKELLLEFKAWYSWVGDNKCLGKTTLKVHFAWFHWCESHSCPFNYPENLSLPLCIPSLIFFAKLHKISNILASESTILHHCNYFVKIDSMPSSRKTSRVTSLTKFYSVILVLFILKGYLCECV